MREKWKGRKYRHRICVRPIADNGRWRTNREWMSDDEYRIVREAMAKRVVV